MARRAAQGTGTIRKKTVTRSGKEYTYWEARVTVGRDPGTGKQIQRSISGKTQKEVREKLQGLTVSVNEGTYQELSKMTVGEWLDIWTRDYLGGVKPYTVASYTSIVKNHIKPALGAVKLTTLNAHTIQGFYNSLGKPRGEKPALAPKTVRGIHAIFHRALQQAVIVGYLRFNPADACTLPRVDREEIKPLDEEQSKAFLVAIKGHRFEDLFTVALFTGMREGEVMGLLWERVDFEQGTILVDRQLQREKKKNAEYVFTSPKGAKSRTITPAPWVMKLLRAHRAKQNEQRLKAGKLWKNSGLVFTNDMGGHLVAHTIYMAFKEIANSIGCPAARFHDAPAIIGLNQNPSIWAAI